MTEQEGIRSSEKMASLVLSIFKGENFVVKGFRTPCRVYLKAKCADLQPELALESGAVELTSTITDPEFNSQLAWSLSKKQLKELRSNRSIIKVTCFVADRIGTETEVGYVVLHVKDATAFGPGVDVDPTKALTFPLLGTKDCWRALQPKLQMILHLEDLTPEKRVQIQTNSMNQNGIKQSLPAPREPNKPAPKQEEMELGIKNAAQLSETKLLPLKDTNKFVWTVRETDGYFQLGNVAEEDDLYILNTTVISASYLHCLWDGKSPRKRTSDNYFWQIKYEAYGCEIASEPFLLGDEDESRRTFIGDKATARIRTNGALFFEYLQETNLQFQIIRYQLGPSKQLTNPEVMGVCFASLTELTNPNKREHRECMEILSEWGTPRVSTLQGKPEVRVLFGLEAVPNYFQICRDSAVETNNNNVIPEVCASDRNSGKIMRNDRHSPIIQTISNDAEVNVQNDVERNEDVPDGASTADMDFDAISNTSNARRLLQFEGQNRQEGSPPPSSSVLTSPERRIPDKHYAEQFHKLSQPSNSNLSESEESENTSNKENLARIMPPLGEYSVTIELNRFWLKSKRIITDDFILSYKHPPLGLSDKPVECNSQPLEPDLSETRHGFVIPDGQFTKTISITKFSERLLNDPLTVEFYRTGQEGKSKCFASAMLPFGRIFSEKGHHNVWIMEDSSDVLKLGQNVKIGTLFYKIKLMQQSSPEGRTEKTTANQRHSSFFPPAAKTNKQLRSPDQYARRDPDKMKKATDDMREWRQTQEEMLKQQKEEKETAYLKILSEEATKRDAEREHALTKKLAELDKKEKELNRQRRLVEEKEERLKQVDNELKDKARKLALDQESLQQQSSLAQRRLEEDHKIEVESLKRRVRGFQDEAEKLKTKVLLLEKKLENKEAEIDNLMALKRELPDVRLQQRVSLLEQENKALKTHLRDANGRKEQYKKQSLALCQKLNRIQEERDHELKDQNENLRLQILASKEHKELKKERKAVQDLSQTLKALQRETVSPSHNDGQGDRMQAQSGGRSRKSGVGIKGENVSKVKEDEIKRLAAERNKLLQTGAYTNYDSVIKELERKMVSLAQE